VEYISLSWGQEVVVSDKEAVGRHASSVLLLHVWIESTWVRDSVRPATVFCAAVS
jgi:hypothetical protein